MSSNHHKYSGLEIIKNRYNIYSLNISSNTYNVSKEYFGNKMVEDVYNLHRKLKTQQNNLVSLNKYNDLKKESFNLIILSNGKTLDKVTDLFIEGYNYKLEIKNIIMQKYNITEEELDNLLKDAKYDYTLKLDNLNESYSIVVTLSNKRKIYELINILEDLGIHIDKKEIEKDPRIAKKIIKEAQKFNNSQLDLICNLILQTFKRAKYTSTEGIHWALDLQIYTHFTSPIRRIADFIVHECLDDLLKLYETDELIIRDNYKPVKYETNIPKKEYTLKKMEIDGIAREATRKERLYDQAENEAAKLILLESLKDQIGKSYNATIQRIFGNYILVKTEEGIEGIFYFENINRDTFDLISKTKKYFLRGRYTGETYKIGNEVNITMINIDELSGDIEFNLNYKLKNLTSRGKVLTNKPNKK